MRYRWDPVYVATGRRTSPATDTHLRASDAERNEVADNLSRHFAEGRLDAAEFKERLDQAMGATTRGDLNGLFDDLPRLVEEPAPPRPRRHRLIPFLFLLAVVAVAAGSTAWSFHLPWLLFVLAALFLWNRSGRFRHHHHGSPGGSDHQVIG
jgi:hypothetical protein